MGGTYGISCHDTHMELSNDWTRHSTNLKVIISTIWEVAVLVLLRKGVYEVKLA
jgi:hypothetical protein